MKSYKGSGATVFIFDFGVDVKQQKKDKNTKKRQVVCDNCDDAENGCTECSDSECVFCDGECEC